MSSLKTFSEYLVEQNVIAVDVLLNTMMAQVKATPSVAEIVFQEKLMDQSRLVSVISLQSIKKMDFISAAKELDFWSADIESKVYSFLEQAQKTLIERLIEAKAISYDQLNKHLDSYLASEPAEKVVRLVETPKVQEEVMPLPDIVSTEVEAPQLVLIDSSLLSAEVLVFSEQFDENIKNRLIELITVAENSVEHPAILEGLHRIAGSARFAKLQRLQEIFTSMENKMNALIKKEGGSDVPTYQKFSSVSLNSMAAIWTLRNHVLQTGGEDGFHQINPAMSQILDLYLKYLHGS